jgi:hypothetical protein
MPQQEQDVPAVNFTHIEHLILQVTADGKGHSPAEMLQCLMDPAADRDLLKHVLQRLRAKLQTLGQDLVAQSFGRRIEYRRVRELRPSPSGTAA